MEVSVVPIEAYREIFQGMSEGIIIVDESENLVIANPMGERLFGYFRIIVKCNSEIGQINSDPRMLRTLGPT